MKNSKSIGGPLFLIAAGVIWLLVQSGHIPASNLWALTHIWPYVIIAAGLGLISRAYWEYASIFMDVIVVGGVAASIVYAPQLKWDKPFMFSLVNQGDVYFGPSITGSGKMVTQTREVNGFKAIQIDYPAQVFITQGDAESLKIEAEDNILPGLRTEVRNGTLNIYYQVSNGEKRVNPTQLVKISIVVKDLNDVNFSSAGELTLNGLKTDKLSVSLSGAGNLKLNQIDVQGLMVSLSGAGNMTASGAAEELDLNISGFGNFNGKELHDQNARANLSGAGSATLWVDTTLVAQISGAGSVNYYGSPNVTKQISGIGGVNQLGNK